jgi:hypothetical protein
VREDAGGSARVIERRVCARQRDTERGATVHEPAVSERRVFTDEPERAERGPGRELQPRALELGCEEAAIEPRIVGDQDRLRHPRRDIAHDVGEPRRPDEVRSTDPVHVRRADVTLGVDQRRELVLDRPIRGHADQGNLDHPIAESRGETGGLDIDDRVLDRVQR